MGGSRYSWESVDVFWRQCGAHQCRALKLDTRISVSSTTVRSDLPFVHYCPRQLSASDFHVTPVQILSAWGQCGMVKDRLLVTIVMASGRTVCEGKSLSMTHKLVVLVLPRSRSRKRSSPQGSHVNMFATRHVVDSHKVAQ